MAVSKRTRFEVLRRDNFTCRYCRSKDSDLTVDHVTPVTLGGSDDPSNLVAACRDCNAGKSSTSPSAETVDDVSADALRWSRAMQAAAAVMEEEASRTRNLTEHVRDRWDEYELRGRPIPLPDGWQSSVMQLNQAGLTLSLLLECVDLAMAGKPRDHWRYFCGIGWKKVAQIQDLAKRVIDAQEVSAGE